MLKTEKLKKEIDVLPLDMLDEVAKFIRNLKSRKKSARKKSPLLSDLADMASEIDIPADFSRQHDHYLYGVPKK